MGFDDANYLISDIDLQPTANTTHPLSATFSLLQDDNTTKTTAIDTKAAEHYPADRLVDWLNEASTEPKILGIPEKQIIAAGLPHLPEDIYTDIHNYILMQSPELDVGSISVKLHIC